MTAHFYDVDWPDDGGFRAVCTCGWEGTTHEAPAEARAEWSDHEEDAR